MQHRTCLVVAAKISLLALTHLSLRSRVTLDELLQNLEHLDDDRLLPSVECRLDGDDKLWDNWQDLVAACLHHVIDALLRKEGVGHLDLAEAVEKYGKVVVEVELVYADLPGNTVVHTAVVDLDRKVPAFVEPELGVGSWNGKYKLDFKCAKTRR